MPPTEAPVKNSVRGPFEADAEHQIDTRILAEARAALEGAAAYFSRNAISGANVRTRYAFGIKLGEGASAKS
jgi:hypothetical protein